MRRVAEDAEPGVSLPEEVTRFNISRMEREETLTKADDIVIPRTAVHNVSSKGIVLDLPDKLHMRALDFADSSKRTDRHPAVLVVGSLMGRHIRVDPHSDIQPTHDLVLDFPHQDLGHDAPSPQFFAHAFQAHREATR